MTSQQNRMIWFTVPRTIAILGLILCFYLGLVGTHLNGFRNGFYASIIRTKGNGPEEIYIPGGPAPFKWTYTGIEKWGVDNQLRTLVGFFGGLIDGESSNRALGVISKYLMVQFAAGWVLISLEGLRGGNIRRRGLGW